MVKIDELSRLSTSSSYYSDKMAQLSQEGGVAFMNFLLATAVPPHEISLPLPSNVKEWQISDIMHMKPQDKKEWKLTCHKELDSLCKRKVFELVNLPEGQKTIINVGSLTSNQMVKKGLNW